MKLLCIFVWCKVCAFHSFAQDTIPGRLPDSLAIEKTLSHSLSENKNSNALDAKVDYESTDSIRFEVKTQCVYMYGGAKINYEEIELHAAFVKIFFKEDLLFAEGVKNDSTGKMEGSPVFKEGDKSYNSKFLKYNYKTKKGFIQNVFTEDGGGFLHGEDVKKMEDESINISRGSFTTCSDEEHPHFEFKFNKSKVIPGKKIITGPAHLVVEGVSTPLFVPFGYFPNKKGQRSGVLIPTYGESANRGFYLENGGYYWAVSDRMDLKMVGDIYSRGSWAVKPGMNYVKRYKYNGSLSLSYAINKTDDQPEGSKDFSVRWQHSQDAKARPNGRFSANVNIVSSKYNIYNPSTTQDYLSNTFQSSISYQTRIANKFQFTMNASHSQNTKTKMVNVTLPEISLSAERFYPFRNKKKVGTPKWYENISVNYTMNARNTLNIADSLLLTPEAIDQLKNGIKHSVPISSSLKVWKYFNLTTSAQFTDRMYFDKYKKRLVTKIINDTTTISEIVTDTIKEFRNVYDFSFTSSLSAKLYGMVAFKKGFLKAVRHVITTNTGFSYTPDFSDEKWGYYGYYYSNDEHTDSTKYSFYDNHLFGTPPGAEQGRINFSISNNLEIKVKSKKDTITGIKKIALIDNFTISTSYDLVKDSLNWSNINMSGRTRLFEKIDLTYSSIWSPYAVNAEGREINKFQWDVDKKPLRKESATWNFGINYRLSSQKPKKDKKETDKDISANKEENILQERQDVLSNPEQYVDWEIPWNVNISYNFRYTNNINYIDFKKDPHKKLVQTLDVNGDINITKKWKIGFRTGYDFENKKISYTSLNVYRDLHCWQMRFNWIPMGQRKSWNFTLNVKSSVLQDLKLTKKKDFRDR